MRAPNTASFQIKICFWFYVRSNLGTSPKRSSPARAETTARHRLVQSFLTTWPRRASRSCFANSSSWTKAEGCSATWYVTGAFGFGRLAAIADAGAGSPAKDA